MSIIRTMRNLAFGLLATASMASALNAAPLTQCGILQGKHYLIEIEGPNLSAGVFYFGVGNAPGVQYTFWANRVPYAAINGDSRPFTVQNDPGRTDLSFRGPYCGVTTTNNPPKPGDDAYFSFQTAPADMAAVLNGTKVPVMRFGNSQFSGLAARVYLLPTPWVPTK